MAHETTHSKTMPDGSKVDILKLHILLADREVREIPLESIQTPSKSKRSGFSLLRLKKSDTAYPLIVDENMFLIDGRHRFFKLVDSGVKIAKVKIATAGDIKSATVENESQLTIERKKP